MLSTLVNKTRVCSVPSFCGPVVATGRNVLLHTLQTREASFTHGAITITARKGTTASSILTAVLHDTFYFCHFHSTTCSKRCAFICHITVFLTTSLQQHPLYRTPPFHSLQLPSSFYCPVLCLTSLIKFPHVIKLHFSKAQQPPKPPRPFLFFFFSHPALSALISLLGFAARFASALTDL